MLDMASELAVADDSYKEMIIKFTQHFLFIASAMNKKGSEGMWDEEDGFYYDLRRFPDGSATKLKVRSLVGLLTLCATSIVEKHQRERIPETMAVIRENQRRMPYLLESIYPTEPSHFGVNERGILALLNQERLRRVLEKMLDENEFLGPHGIRSISK